MLLYEELHDLFTHVKMPNVMREHWSDNAGWEMAEALDALSRMCDNASLLWRS